MHPDEVFELRKKLGLTQTQFADRLGVAFATVNRWENGHTKPTPRQVRAMLALSGVEDRKRSQISTALREIIRQLHVVLKEVEDTDEARELARRNPRTNVQ